MDERGQTLDRGFGFISLARTHEATGCLPTGVALVKSAKVLGGKSMVAEEKELLDKFKECSFMVTNVFDLITICLFYFIIIDPNVHNVIYP